jgi:cell division septum initiation protein DivIVA
MKEVDIVFDELEAKLDILLQEQDRILAENKTLKQEVEILTEALRAIQWRMDGLDK